MNELYKLPQGWEWKKLGDLTKLQNGFAFKSDLFVNTGLPIIRIKNIKHEKIILNDVVYFDKNDYLKNLDVYKIKINDILIAMSGATTGKLGFYQSNEEAYLNQRVGLFRIENFNLRIYLFYFLSTQIEKNLEQSLGAAQPNLSTDQINNIDVPLPPLPEQQTIVSKLDKLFTKIDTAITLHQKNIDEADILMASILNEVFEELEEKYKIIKIDDIVRIIGGGTPSKNKKEYWENGNIKWATVGDMNVETIVNTELSVTEKGLKESSAHIIPKEGIIIATRVGLGKVCYLASNIAINQDLKGLIPLDKQIDIRFLFNFFKYIKYYIIQNGTGTTVKGVKLDFIKQIQIPLPPLPIQQKVVAYLDKISNKIEKLKQLQKSKMTNLKALKASILDQAFRGQL